MSTAVFDAAARYAASTGAEAAIQRVGCGCYRVAAPANPDSLADCWAVLGLARAAGSCITARTWTGGGSIAAIIHEPHCRAGRPA
ncbi:MULTISPECIES: hypothetical protein [Kitasatospora]|uniref:hypothetical protein n=1 Tax=Kitasatospora TaxID=2063 RepID=UPI000524851D|nr:MULTISPECIES: hypothetical protein [Kitasatospora]